MTFRMRISTIASAIAFALFTLLATVAVLGVRASEWKALFARLETVAKQARFEFAHGDQSEIQQIGDYTVSIYTTSGLIVWNAGQLNLRKEKGYVAFKDTDGASVAQIGLEDEDYLVLVGHRSAAAFSATQGLTWLSLFTVPLMTAFVGYATFLATGSIAKRLQELASQAKAIASQSEERYLKVKGDDEVAETAGHIDDLLKRVFDETKKREDLVADIAHDLRSPITALKGRLETTRLTAKSPQDYDRFVSDALIQANRLSSLVNGTLELYSDTGADGTSALKEVRTEIERRWGDILAHVGLSITFEGDEVLFPIGPLALERVIDNAVTNVVRHAKDAKNIRVNAWKDRTGLYLQIANDGTSGAPIIRSARSRGLSIVQRLIQNSGGQVETPSIDGFGFVLECLWTGDVVEKFRPPDSDD